MEAITPATDNQLSDVLSNNYMLASLIVSTWSGRKTDKNATIELLTAKGAASNAASVVKSLLAGNDKELRDTQAAYARIRTWFYANSLPWSANEGANRGDRLVGTTQAMTFLRDFANLKSDAMTARDNFVDAYDAAVANASVSLGGLYDVTQYPSSAQIATLFGASLDIAPMPALADFDRVSIPGAMAQGLKGLYEKRASKQVERAITDCQQRLLDELQRMSTQLTKVVKGEPTRLHKTLITNMETVVGLAKSIGPLCPELDALASKIKLRLLANPIEDYKENMALARVTANAANEFIEELGIAEPSDETIGTGGTVIESTPPSVVLAQAQAAAASGAGVTTSNDMNIEDFDPDDAFKLGL